MNKKELLIYDEGLTDGYYGRVFNPHYNWTKEEKDLYKAGFDKAREY